MLVPDGLQHCPTAVFVVIFFEAKFVNSTLCWLVSAVHAIQANEAKEVKEAITESVSMKRQVT